jgi:hypothetical protein
MVLVCIMGDGSILDWGVHCFLGGGPFRVYLRASCWAVFHAWQEVGAPIVNVFCSLTRGSSEILSSRLHLHGWVWAISAARSLLT